MKSIESETKTATKGQTVKTTASGSKSVNQPMTVRAVSRIYSATAHQNQGNIPAGSFAARAARAAANTAPSHPIIQRTK